MKDNFTRREWGGLMLTGLGALMIPSVLSSCKTQGVAVPSVLKGTAAAKQAAGVGVVLGAQTYSFRDRDLDGAIKAMTELGIKSCELWDGHVRPKEYTQRVPNQTPEESKRKADALRQWGESHDMTYAKSIKAKFDAAGITIMAYTDGFGDKMSDAAMERIFKMTEAFGSNIITTSSTVSVMKRVDVFAQQYKIKVGMHGHSNTKDPNQFSSPDSFARGMAGLSEYICINLDIGHFTAANFDAVDFIKQHHDRIVCLHIKDRKKNDGENMPLGQGDTPIGEVLRLVRDNKYPIPADIEYEYKGTGDSVAEVGKCLDYCRKMLKA
jgi:sugar phosphate isomerase/epimerase